MIFKRFKCPLKILSLILEKDHNLIQIMIFLSDLNHDLNQRFKSNDLNHNNPG